MDLFDHQGEHASQWAAINDQLDRGEIRLRLVAVHLKDLRSALGKDGEESEEMVASWV